MTFWTNKRVMLTGGGGFIGIHVAECLRQRGVNDFFVVRRKDYDLTREDEVARLFKEHPADILIHVAGLVGGILAIKTKPVDFYYDNVLMAAYVMHHAWQSGTKKFISIGAGCGYPQDAPNPLKEDDLWNGFPQPETAPYALAKRLLAVQADAYSKEHGFLAISTIPGNVYGPYDNFNLQTANVIPALVRKFVEAADQNAPTVEVWGSGRAARDFVFAPDLADGMLRSIEVLDQSIVINLSAGEDTPIRHVVDILRDVTGYRGEVVWNSSRPDGQLHRRLDTTKAETLLGWKAKTSLEDGLRLTVEWYRKNQNYVRK